MTPPRRSTVPQPPWLPAPFDLADAHAVRAVTAGVADADQQRRAMKWIIERCAATYQDTHFPTGRDTTFANGRRFVGLRLVTIINLPAEALAKIAETRDVTDHDR